MACSIGAADSRHATVRPVLVRVMRPASASTSRCFITAGRDIANGSASSETDTSPLSNRRASSARRVGSASAAKVRSRSCNLTMRLSVGHGDAVSRGWSFGLFVGIRGLAFCWHPRFVIGASSVAPVRGGTYFSLPPQRKVGKRKRLTPPARVPIHGPPTSPSFTRQHLCLRALPTL